jgi:hypothetical protein
MCSCLPQSSNGRSGLHVPDRQAIVRRRTFASRCCASSGHSVNSLRRERIARDGSAHGVLLLSRCRPGRAFCRRRRRFIAVSCPMADRLVPDVVAAKVVEHFAEIERNRVGEGKHEAYHAMLHTLKDRYGVERRREARPTRICPRRRELVGACDTD